MAFTIAVAGKGGVGKTTVSGLLVQYLEKHKLGPILAVDADPNTNLNEVLGLELHGTLGEARENMKKGVSDNMTKDLYIQMKVNQCLSEGKGFDIISMGQPEGSGCYCAANHVLTNCIDKLISNYRFLVIDNEAGMEHISRVTTQKVDLLLLVSDFSRRGIATAKKVQDLAKELKILNGDSLLILSKVDNTINKEILLNTVSNFKLNVIGIIPTDNELAKLDMMGDPISKLSNDNMVVTSTSDIFRQITNIIQTIV